MAAGGGTVGLFETHGIYPPIGAWFQTTVGTQSQCGAWFETRFQNAFETQLECNKNRLCICFAKTFLVNIYTQYRHHPQMQIQIDIIIHNCTPTHIYTEQAPVCCLSGGVHCPRRTFTARAWCVSAVKASRWTLGSCPTLACTSQTMRCGPEVMPCSGQEQIGVGERLDGTIARFGNQTPHNSFAKTFNFW